MARKKIREYDAKRLYVQHIQRYLKAPLPKMPSHLEPILISDPVHDHSDLHSLKEMLKKSKEQGKEIGLVVKPDMMFGKRGKLNLVCLNANYDTAKKFLTQNAHKEIEIEGVRGRLEHFLIEPFIAHKEEFYLSILAEREDTVVRFCNQGGINIEDHWDQVLEIRIPVGESLLDRPLASLLESQLKQFPQTIQDNTVLFIQAVYQFFEDMDFTNLEMNPFCFEAPDVFPVPLDMVVEVDDTAMFQNRNKWGNLPFPPPFGVDHTPEELFVEELDAKTGASLKLKVLNPTGRIWTLVAGGGASVIFADTVSDLGLGKELGNYGEYSGGPNEEETYLYAKTVLDLATRNPDARNRALLIGGGIANFTDIQKTFKGIVHALREFQEKLKAAHFQIYVRRAGPNYKAGLELMQKLGEELALPIFVFGPEKDMTEIIPLAISYVNQSNKN